MLRKSTNSNNNNSVDVGFSKTSHPFIVVAFEGVVICFGGGRLLDGDGSFC